MTQRDQVVGDVPDCRRVVDADQVGTGDARLVTDHRRHRPGQCGRQVRIVVGHRIDDETVDGRAGHPEHVLGVRPGRHQQQAHPGLVALQRQTLQEGDRARVAEGVRHLLGEQQPHRAGLAGAQ